MPKIGMEPVRRDALIRAAIVEVGAMGSLDVTVSRIARRAGVSPALAHHYFGSKEQILLAAMRRILSDFGTSVRERIRAARTPRARLAAIFEACFTPEQFEPSVVVAWLNFYVHAHRSPDASRLLAIYARRLDSNLVHAPAPPCAGRRGPPHRAGPRLDDRRTLHPRRSAGPRPHPHRRHRHGVGLPRPLPEQDSPMSDKPNVLIFMADQLNGTLFPDGPADFLKTPNLDRLAARAARFSNAYTGSPLCAPGRASFMAGQLPHRTRVYDNAAEFSSDTPTYAHHLRRAGYATTLSGKMHFVGPDQLHGFEERLTTDVYPADFGWTPDYRKPGTRINWWYHNLGSVTGAGIGEISNQLEYDDEVAYEATRKVYDLGRRLDPRPWMMTVSFTHPHDPYVARRKHWDLYADCAHLEPTVPALAYEEHDRHSQRIFDANDWKSYDISAEDIRRSRRAYFANVSYIDEKIGDVMEALTATDQVDNTIILFLSDHGDMLGERGLWFKMSFFEGSARVPLMIAAPGMPAGRVDTPVSTIDINADTGGSRRHRPQRGGAVDRWGQPRAGRAGGRARSGADGVCGRGVRGAARRPARRALQVRALRTRPAAALRPRGGSERAEQPRR